jgi:hypothetical protein
VVARWSDPDPKYVALIKEGGITAVLPERGDSAFESALQNAGIKVVPQGEIQLLKLDEIEKARPGAPVALKSGLWPGISRGGAQTGTDETASASRQPWVDANGFWVQWLRVMYPRRAGVSPDRVLPFSTHELGLIEAWAFGGNWIVSLEPRFKEALLKGEPKALDAWRELGRTAGWLREHAGLFGKPVFPEVTMLVEGGEETAELANLAYRQNACPCLAPAQNPPPPDPARRLAIVAANLHAPATPVRVRILAHAEAGASVVTAAPADQNWWRDPRLKPVKSQEDRDFFALGKGQVVAYKDAIVDPSEFALDIIDIVTHRRRAVRLWNALTVIALATSSNPATEAHVVAVNYGQPIQRDIQVRVQGIYKKARLLCPGKQPLDLKTAKRGSTTEVFLPELGKLGVVVFG